MEDNIRILSLPTCKMATSGFVPCAFDDAHNLASENPFVPGGQLLTFADWWSDVDSRRKDRWFARDYLMYDRVEKALIWYYALPDDANEDIPYAIVPFEGGLYASDVAIDGDHADEQRVYGAIKTFIEHSDVFVLDERAGHYDLCTVITPPAVQNRQGFAQLEILVPIALRS